MRCYRCEAEAFILFPALQMQFNRRESIPVTVYLCAVCHKSVTKQLREEVKK